MGAILLIALLLRAPYLFWGVPVFDKYAQPYHPDEGKIIGGAMTFPEDIFTREDLRYPTGMHYFTGMVLLPFKSLTNLDAIPRVDFKYIATIVARLVTLALGLGAVWLTYRLGKKLYSPAVGLLAASFLAVAVYHARHSPLATTDVGTSFWLALALLLTYRFTADSRWQNYALMGAVVGLGTGTKYSTAIAAVGVGIILLQLVLQTDDAAAGKRIFAYTLMSAGIAIVVFLLTTPTMLINGGAFLQSFGYEAGRVARARNFVFDLETANILLTDSWAMGMGWALFFVVWFGIAYSLVRRETRQHSLPLAATSLIYLFIFLSGLLARYVITILPLLCLLAALPIVDLLKDARKRRRLAGVAISAGILLYGLFYNVQTMRLVLDDTRSQAAAYLEATVPPGSTVGALVVGNVAASSWNLPFVDDEKYMLADGLDLPEYMILTSYLFYDFRDLLNSGNVGPDYALSGNVYWPHPTRPEPEVLAIYDHLLNGAEADYKYELVAVFKPAIYAPVEFPPPEIRIYRRVSP